MITLETERCLNEAAAEQGKDSETLLKELLSQNFKTAVILASPVAPETIRETDYAALSALLLKHRVRTGIVDLAHEHEHYLYGIPKQGNDSA